jgi:hypothetical protein
MIFSLQAEECTMTPYQDGYDVIIRGKLYFGQHEFLEGKNILFLYRDDDEVGYINLDSYTLYDMDMNGNRLKQEYYYEGRIYERQDDQLISNGHVIAYLDTSTTTSDSDTNKGLNWVWLVDYTKEGRAI